MMYGPDSINVLLHSLKRTSSLWSLSRLISTIDMMNVNLGDELFTVPFTLSMKPNLQNKNRKEIKTMKYVNNNSADGWHTEMFIVTNPGEVPRTAKFIYLTNALSGKQVSREYIHFHQMFIYLYILGWWFFI